MSEGYAFYRWACLTYPFITQPNDLGRTSYFANQCMLDEWKGRKRA